MPNHITNEITGPAAIREALTRTRTTAERFAHDKSEEERWTRFVQLGREEEFEEIAFDMNERIVDFGLLIPEPENIERGDCNRQHTPGEICWHEWKTAHWGTKWNGYDLEVTDHDDGTVTVRFDTAWAHPHPVIEKLSKRFPEAELRVKYADEDLGYNLGEYTITNDERSPYTSPVEGTNGALDFATQLKHGMTYAELEAEYA